MKAFAPIDVTVLGMVTDVILMLLVKAPSPMATTVYSVPSYNATLGMTTSPEPLDFVTSHVLPDFVLNFNPLYSNVNAFAGTVIASISAKRMNFAVFFIAVVL